LRPLLLGRSANVTVLDDDEVEERGRAGSVGDGEVVECDRFTRFAGGEGASAVPLAAADGLDAEGR
jgi:hypothetical protein